MFVHRGPGRISFIDKGDLYSMPDTEIDKVELANSDKCTQCGRPYER